jgi:molybdenum cofactor cytidylyltransferase
LNHAPRIGCIVMAAGRSRRFGRTRINKLLAPLRDRCVVEQVLREVLKSQARPIVVVTGHQRVRVEQALQPARGKRWRTRFNPQFRLGMASSLQAGVRALPGSLDGVVVCLGDMPGVSAKLIDKLIAAFREGDDAVLPKVGERRGNPVLLGRELLARVSALSGDQGARPLLKTSRNLRFVDADRSALLDIDTRRDWRAFRRRR